MKTLQTLRSEFIDSVSVHYDEGEAGAMFRHLTAGLADPNDLDALEQRLEAALPGLRSGKPFQYVTGEAWFYGMTLKVSPAVLIPRPETEELVQRIVDDERRRGRAGEVGGIGEDVGADSGAEVDFGDGDGSDTCPRIIDIGTGSGCIALALKRALPSSEVYALDVSGEALSVARRNAEAQNLSIKFIEADILEWEIIMDPQLRFDVIVSNPPYITPAEKRAMEQQVLRHEPELALFAPEEAPLLFYQHIADFGLQHLQAGGRLYFEINRQFGADVVHLLDRKGYTSVELLQDMQGADRMICAIAP